MEPQHQVVVVVALAVQAPQGVRQPRAADLAAALAEQDYRGLLLAQQFFILEAAAEKMQVVALTEVLHLRATVVEQQEQARLQQGRMVL
jgi:hypothetical protein